MKENKNYIFAGILLLVLLLLPSISAKGATSIDVTSPQYGAIPNDGQSDANAIQTALNTAKGSTAVITVTIPAGTYYIDKALHIYSNTYLKLSAKTHIIRMDSAVNFNMLHAVDQNNQMDQIGKYDMCHNITIDGGIWDGGNAKTATESTDLIRFDHGKNIVIKNCTLKNVYDCHLLEFVGIKNGQILNCKFSGFYYNKKHKNQLEYGREAIQLDSAWTNNPSNLNDKNAQWAGGSKVDGTHNENITVKGCTFTNYPICVGQHHYSSSPKYSNSKNIIITENTIVADSKYTYFKTAISCGGLDDTTISNNTIVGPYRFAINVYHAKNITLTGNTIKNMTYNGIMVDTAVLTKISSNKISNIKKHGISILNSTIGSSKNTSSGIIGNKISTCNINGICIADSSKVYYIAENTVKKCKQHGISILNSTIGIKSNANSGIINNTFNANKKNGICVSQKAIVYYIAKNTITASGQHAVSLVDKAVVGNTSYKNSGVYANTITDSGANGICIAGKSVAYINKNKITNSQKNAISFTVGKIYAIQNNTIKKAQKGMYLFNHANVKKISGNKFTSCIKNIT